MSNIKISQKVLNQEEKITLDLLEMVEENSAITQRSLAAELNVALGLTNSYVKRCAKKGLIKVKQVPSNRYAYYLTPSGFAEKSRLTAEYLKQSFNFFRMAKGQSHNLLQHLLRLSLPPRQLLLPRLPLLRLPLPPLSQILAQILLHPIQ